MPDSLFKFSHQYRLRNKQDIQSVFAEPYKIAHRCLLVLYKPNQRSHARLGIIISKQHLKLAVHRNSMRRIIRESFRCHKEMLKGLDIIVLVRSKCIPATRSALGREQKLQTTIKPGNNKRDHLQRVGPEDIAKLWLQITHTYKPVC